MSKAGIQSNRGDGYGTLIAMDYALDVLSNPDKEWLEIDSTTFSVDDIVVGSSNGTKICIQCKKNQPTHNIWTIADLKIDLKKAGELLGNDPDTVVRFYSRSGFALSALKEYASNYPSDAEYLANMPNHHCKAKGELTELLRSFAPRVSTYEFLQRTEYTITESLERLKEKLLTRTGQLASSSNAAYQALWTRLDELGMRLRPADVSASNNHHRLTKSDLIAVLCDAGAILTPPFNSSDTLTALRGISGIGRAWRRTIGGETLSFPLVEELIAAIHTKPKSILLTGQPGSGKTCVMLALQEALERRQTLQADLLAVFIQSREFADQTSSIGRQAQGLPDNWVERISRLADDQHVVVVVDSLDVLSIARERTALKYFLAQIDRLLLIANVTIITACRAFDRRYDQIISQRQWGKEFSCPPLDWRHQILPLLTLLDIDCSGIDAPTLSLLTNPRELALFVELAQQHGSFNVVSSQALTARYLAKIVRDNDMLGDAAMHCLEAMADSMLKQRSLSIAEQQFLGTQSVKRALLSHDILRETPGERLIFGHQTLLDALVISAAIRRGETLNEFIRGLSPVPFVRPSIRRFMAQLVTGSRTEFRKQVRTVLSSPNPFHIRRLVAECFAEQLPHDDDWGLLRDLRATIPELFRAIYYQATHLEWHRFWLKHLVPALDQARDGEGLIQHASRIGRWINDDPAGSMQFWLDTLSKEWVNSVQAADQVTFALMSANDEVISIFSPVIQRLIELQKRQHSFLGKLVARCVTAGGIDDSVLWRHITSDVTDENVGDFPFANHLHCGPDEFGNANDGFLSKRMVASTDLLDLSVAAIEHWSQIKRAKYYSTTSGFGCEFLRQSSFSDTHSRTDSRHIDGENMLLNAIESAVIQHAIANSAWWIGNRVRLLSNNEGALRYFAIKACIKAPNKNLTEIGRILTDGQTLDSELAFELGNLSEAAFVKLDPATQILIQAAILDIDSQRDAQADQRRWTVQRQSQLILSMPTHLRSTLSHSIIAEAERDNWPVERQPQIHQRGGWVRPPFTFEIFLAADDSTVLRLLNHYHGYIQSYDDFLRGGEEEVGVQLQEASSRHPTRFLMLLQNHWSNINSIFCNNILDGVAKFLAYRHGKLTSDSAWQPLEDAAGSDIASLVLDELERHPAHWHHNRDGAKALEACAPVILSTAEADRLVFLAVGYLTLREAPTLSGKDTGLVTIGINMAQGDVADALMGLATHLGEIGIRWPDLLSPVLRAFCTDAHPAIRAVILRRLAYLQQAASELGWELFSMLMHGETKGLWKYAEACLYYAYHRRIDLVQPWLTRLGEQGGDEDLETWGRLSALVGLGNAVYSAKLLARLRAMDSDHAWRGAATVWTEPENWRQNPDTCVAGISAGFKLQNSIALMVASEFCTILQKEHAGLMIPIELVASCFALLATEPPSSRMHRTFGVNGWLNALSMTSPDSALAAAEIYLRYLGRAEKSHLHDHEDQLTQLLTRLFAQAEEQEELDAGVMLRRVVAIQGSFLALGLDGMNDWLKASERP